MSGSEHTPWVEERRRSVGIVPVVDLEAFRNDASTDAARRVVDEVRDALETIGFFVVTGHGIPASLQDRTLAVGRAFFDLSEPDKLRCCDDQNFLGYNPLGAERVAYAHHDESGPDLKANFTAGRIGIDRSDPYFDCEAGRQWFPPNLWPERPEEFRETLAEYAQAGERLAHTLMELFARALELEPGYFRDKVEKCMTYLRVLDYPALPDVPQPNQYRIGPHSDYGTLTLVTADGPGLQVKTRSGVWEEVPYVPGGIQVNIGDMMEQWTNDRWVSTQHRVLAPDDPAERRVRRQAIAFFLTANYDTVIAPVASCVDGDHPARYAPVPAGEELLAKLLRQYERGESAAS